MTKSGPKDYAQIGDTLFEELQALEVKAGIEDARRGHFSLCIIRHSPDKCRLKTTLRLFVVIGKPGSPRTRLRRV